MNAVPTNAVPTNAVPTNAVPTNAVPTNAVPTNADKPLSLPSQAVPGNAVADGLIAAGSRPLVLGFVAVGSVDGVAGALFEALAHVSNGADGIDLMLPTSMGPAERLAAADQLAEATGASLYLRTDVPMASGQHALILSTADGRVRSGANVFYDIGIDQSGAPADEAVDDWPTMEDERSLLVSTVGFRGLSDAALMGLVSAASARGVAAVSTDRAHIVRRVVDTLAPLSPKIPKAGVTPCR